MRSKPPASSTKKYPSEKTSFLSASFQAKKEVYVLTGVSPSFRQAVGWKSDEPLPPDLWAVLPGVDKAKFTSAIKFALLYSAEGENAYLDVYLQDAERGTTLREAVFQAEKIGDSTYQIDVIFLLKQAAVKANLPPLSLPEKTGQGSLLLSLEGNLDTQQIVRQSIEDENLRSFFPESKDFEAWHQALLTLRLAQSEKRKDIEDFFNPESLRSAYEKGQQNFHLRIRLAPEADIPVWVDLNLTLQKEKASDPLSFFLEAIDVTEPLLEKEMMRQLPLFGVDVLGLVYLPEKKCRYYRIEKMGLGMRNAATWDYEEAILNGIDVLVAKDDIDEVKEALSLKHIVEALKSWPSYSTAYTLLRRDGTKRRKRFQFTYLDESQQTLFFIRSDLTANYLKEQEQIAKLETAKQKAEEAYESKSIFLSSMSHDIRSPLNGILGFTELALQEKDPKKKDQDLQLIRSSGNFLLSLVNDTLDLSRYESGKAEMELASVSLRDAFETVLASLRGAAELKTIWIIKDAEIPDAYVETDGLKFQKVFLNLLSNAIKYTPSGGEIHVSLRAHKKDANGCNYTLSVRDNGIGIEPAFLPHIFEAFSQEKRQESKNILGTGLGLAIVKRIVTMMAGRIEVESQVNHGTTFRVSFPFSPAEKRQEEAKETFDDVSFAGLHVLLAEDNVINQQIETILLEGKGLIVTAVVNGELALQEFKKSKPGFYSAIFLDNQMPIMNGVEAAKKIRALKRSDAKSVPLIALTGDAFQEDIASFDKAGMNGTIVKPVDSYRLFALLKKLLQK